MRCSEISKTVKSKNRECDSRDRRLRLGEKINHRNGEQYQRDQTEPNRNFLAENHGVQRHAVLAVLRVRVAQDQHRDALHRKTPDHSEGVKVPKKGHVAAARNDGDDLKQDHHIDDPVGGAKPGVRMPEPVR